MERKAFARLVESADKVLLYEDHLKGAKVIVSGKMGMVVKQVGTDGDTENDEIYQVKFEDGSVKNIPARDMEMQGDESKKPSENELEDLVKEEKKPLILTGPSKRAREEKPTEREKPGKNVLVRTGPGGDFTKDIKTTDVKKGKKGKIGRILSLFMKEAKNNPLRKPLQKDSPKRKLLQRHLEKINKARNEQDLHQGPEAAEKKNESVELGEDKKIKKLKDRMSNKGKGGKLKYIFPVEVDEDISKEHSSKGTAELPSLPAVLKSLAGGNIHDRDTLNLKPWHKRTYNAVRKEKEERRKKIKEENLDEFRMPFLGGGRAATAAMARKPIPRGGGRGRSPHRAARNSVVSRSEARSRNGQTAIAAGQQGETPHTKQVGDMLGSLAKQYLIYQGISGVLGGAGRHLEGGAKPSGSTPETSQQYAAMQPQDREKNNT